MPWLEGRVGRSCIASINRTTIRQVFDTHAENMLL